MFQNYQTQLRFFESFIQTFCFEVVSNINATSFWQVVKVCRKNKNKPNKYCFGL